MGFIILVQLVAIISANPKSAIVVKVNGTAITQADVDFAAMQKGLPDENRSQSETKLIEELIERQLIRAFLTSRKVEPVAEELQFQIATAEELIRKRGEDPQKLLTKLGYTPDRLKRELGLPLAWRVYANRTITDAQLKDFFIAHKQELDGTELRARQIFLKLSKSHTDADVVAKSDQLTEIRKEIVDRKLSFAEAASQHSEAPTRDQGGDVGLFGWRGKMPSSVSQAAFGLQVEEISEPIVSPFGVHLIQVTERHPGELSLEDVRPVVLEQLSQELWTATVAKERTTAKIERDRK